MMKSFVTALALVSVLGLAQARSTVALIEPSRVVLVATAEPLTLDGIRSAIVRGGARHGWTVQNDAPGKMTLKYNKQNKHEVVVDVSYDTTGFQIRYVSSSNMKYEDVGGQALIHPFYNTWVANLSRAISIEASGIRGN